MLACFKVIMPEGEVCDVIYSDLYQMMPLLEFEIDALCHFNNYPTNICQKGRMARWDVGERKEERKKERAGVFRLRGEVFD